MKNQIMTMILDWQRAVLSSIPVFFAFKGDINTLYIKKIKGGILSDE